jgi:hypothetical protein
MWGGVSQKTLNYQTFQLQKKTFGKLFKSNPNSTGAWSGHLMSPQNKILMWPHSGCDRTPLSSHLLCWKLYFIFCSCPRSSYAGLAHVPTKQNSMWSHSGRMWPHPASTTPTAPDIEHALTASSSISCFLFALYVLTSSTHCH